MARLIVSVMILLFSSLSVYALETNNNSDFNIPAIIQLTGHKGSLDKNNHIYKIVVPRNDLDIVINGAKITAEMGLLSWVSFKKIDSQTVIVGDLALLQDQVNPVMSVVLNSGLQVTGLQSPFLWDSPRVLLMHISGVGDERQLATAVGKAFAKIKQTSNGNGDFPIVSSEEIPNTISTYRINSILGVKGLLKNGVYKVSLQAPQNKAIYTWAAFSGNNNEAMVDGSIALPAAQLQQILKFLRNQQIYILSIYQNSMNNDPNFIFIHYWGVGKVTKLAQTLHTVMLQVKPENPALTPPPIANTAPVQLPIVHMNKLCALTEKPHTEIAPKKPHELINTVSEYITLISMEVAAKILESQKQFTAYTEDFATALVYGLVVGLNDVHRQAHIITVQKPAVIPASANNNFLLLLLSFQKKDYNYAARFIHNNPVYFPVEVEQHKIVQETQPNEFLSAFLVSQKRNYNYLTQLRNAYPMAFAMPTIPELPKIQQAPAQPNEFLIAFLTIHKKNYNYAMQLVNAYPVTFPTILEKPKQIQSLPNQFLIVLLNSQKHNYHYAEQLVRTYPVIFSNQIENNVKSDSLNPFLVALLKTKKPDYHYAAQLAQAYPVTFPNQIEKETKSDTVNPFLVALLKTKKPNYHYAAQLAQAYPVTFPNQIEKETKSDTANPFLVALLKTKKPHYHYAAQLVQAYPVIFTNEIAKPVVTAQSNLFLLTLLSTQAKNYHYAEQLSKTFPVTFPQENPNQAKKAIIAHQYGIQQQPEPRILPASPAKIMVQQRPHINKVVATNLMKDISMTIHKVKQKKLAMKKIAKPKIKLAVKKARTHKIIMAKKRVRIHVARNYKKSVHKSIVRTKSKFYVEKKSTDRYPPFDGVSPDGASP